MKRIMLLAISVMLGGAMAGCDKPTADECKSALENMQTLLGTAKASATADIQSDIRRCRGGSSKTAIQCANAAKTVEELKACQFMSSKGEKK